MLAAITLTDLERRVIPNRILLAGAVAGLAIAAATDPSSLPERGIAAAAAGGLLLLIALAYPRGMGMGDVKLAAVMGLYLGSVGGSAALAVGVITGTVVGTGRHARHRAPGPGSWRVPFGPFLALGGVVGPAGGRSARQLLPERIRPLVHSHQSWVWRN